MRALLTAASLALLALPGAAFANDKHQADGEQELAKQIEGRVAGEPVRCVPLSALRSSRIIDRTAIVYGSGSRIYVNRPTAGASSLDDDQILVTKTHSSQLCNIDKVDLISQGSRSWEGFVSLGDFVPYDRVKTSRR